LSSADDVKWFGLATPVLHRQTALYNIAENLAKSIARIKLLN